MEENIKQKWANLHEELVNKVIEFCKENNITDVTDFYLNANCLNESIKYGSWHPATDSVFELVKFNSKNGFDKETILFSA